MCAKLGQSITSMPNLCLRYIPGDKNFHRKEEIKVVELLSANLECSMLFDGALKTGGHKIHHCVLFLCRSAILFDIGAPHQTCSVVAV